MRFYIYLVSALTFSVPVNALSDKESNHIGFLGYCRYAAEMYDPNHHYYRGIVSAINDELSKYLGRGDDVAVGRYMGRGEGQLFQKTLNKKDQYFYFFKYDCRQFHDMAPNKPDILN